MTSKKTFIADFRTFFLRGLGIVLPSILTLALLFWAYGFLQQNVAEPINSLVRQGTILIYDRVDPAEPWRPRWYVVTDEEIDDYRRQNPRQRNSDKNEVIRTLREQEFRKYWQDHFWLEAIGVVIAVVLIYLAGVLVGNYVGRRLYVRVEKLITRVPVIKQVYPSVKQIVDFLLGDGNRKLDAERVVLVEYPRRGIWTVGLLTGSTMRAIEEIAGVECVTVFIPSSPTPFTGYTITVPRADVVELPISLDEALKFVISGGVLIPANQAIVAGREPRPLASQPGKAPDRQVADLAERSKQAMMGERNSGSGGDEP
ncbi:MAG: DUF502 domain-containing protein [Phycisphaerales bacterium]|nr:DUF502 domain-containing protein [Phycisphaerales bacterium]